MRKNNTNKSNAKAVASKTVGEVNPYELKTSPKQLIKQIKMSTSLEGEQKKVAQSFHKNSFTFVFGEMGSGKTFSAVHTALNHLVNGDCKEIWITRPIVPNNLGILPGAQPYSSKILTPNGWTTMGEIKKGDEVYTPEGKIVKVLETFEHGERDTFKVSTNYGRSTIACDKHLWEVQECNYRRKLNNPKLVDTTFIKDNLFNNEGSLRFKLPLNGIIPFKEVELPVDPYVLGVLLGDGNFGESISFTSIDKEIVDNVKNLLGDYFSVNKIINSISYTISTNNKNNKPAKAIEVRNNETGDVKTYERIGLALEDLDINRSTLNDRCVRNATIGDYTYSFIDDRSEFTNILKQKIHELGLLGKTHIYKFIPEIYKFSSVEQRLELLRGLLDTDGSIKKNGEVVFHNSSKHLIDGVTEIVRSLGGRTYLTIRDRIGETAFKDGREITTKHIGYDLGISFNEWPDLFKLTRKKNRLKKYSNIHKEFVSSVEFNGREKVKCILIDDPRHLYITDEYIVTHNTIEEKLDPYVFPMVQNLNICIGVDLTKRLMEIGVIKIMPIDVAKGCTFNDSVVIFDEFQDTNYEDFRTLITRLGKTSKMILCGSKEQISRKINKYSCIHVALKIENQDGVGSITLTNNHRNPALTTLLPILDKENDRYLDTIRKESDETPKNDRNPRILLD